LLSSPASRIPLQRSDQLIQLAGDGVEVAGADGVVEGGAQGADAVGIQGRAEDGGGQLLLADLARCAGCAWRSGGTRCPGRDLEGEVQGVARHRHTGCRRTARRQRGDPIHLRRCQRLDGIDQRFQRVELIPHRGRLDLGVSRRVSGVVHETCVGLMVFRVPCSGFSPQASALGFQPARSAIWRSALAAIGLVASLVAA
jgi:hypothetical protein